MKKEKVISSYVGLSDDELSVFGGKVVQSLTDNANFATTIPPLTDLESLSEDYRLKQENASHGGSTLDKRLRDEAKVQLLTALSRLAHFVNVESNGNLAKLTSSGLILQKSAESTRVPSVVSRVRLKDGQLSGQMHVLFDAQNNIWEYEIQLGQREQEEEAVTWGESYFTTSSLGNIITGLTPRQVYFVRVRARNGKGYGDWNDYVSMIVR